MSSTYKKSYQSSPLFSTQNLILGSIAWGVLSVLYFLLFSAQVPNPSADGGLSRPEWYILGTNIFEGIAYLIAGILSLRNWNSTKIVTGRSVWLTMSIGMLSYCVGGIFFGYTELVLKQEPFPSIGDIFFVIAYIFIGASMVTAVVSRRINLEAWQWIVVLAIGAFASALAWLISNQPPGSESQVEAWAKDIAPVLNWFYVICDVFLLIIATSLLLAFWGGRMSLSWRMIAFAAFSLYIADMWQKFATTWIPNYQSGEILEVFWVLSGVLFGMGAVLEYDASLSRSRNQRGRKRT